MLVKLLYFLGILSGPWDRCSAGASESVAVAEDGSLYLPDRYGSILRATLTGTNYLSLEKLACSHCVKPRGIIRPHRLLQAAQMHCISH